MADGSRGQPRDPIFQVPVKKQAKRQKKFLFQSAFEKPIEKSKKPENGNFPVVFYRR